MDTTTTLLVLASGIVVVVGGVLFFRLHAFLALVLGASVVAAIAIILREILISGLREAVSARGGVLPVTRIAKWKTATQIIAAGLLLATAPQGLAGEEYRPIGVGALWLAVILTIWTGAAYSVGAARLLNERKG